MAKSHAGTVQLRQVLNLFALLGHSMRVVVMQRLARAPGTAGELAAHLPVSRTAVVQHLKLLEAAGLVHARYEGKRRVYRVRPAGLRPMTEWIARIGGDRV